jgi:hypothetical protein
MLKTTSAQISPDKVVREGCNPELSIRCKNTGPVPPPPPPLINTPPSYTPHSPYTRFQHIKYVGLLIFSIHTQGKAMREN